jgi:hypothetical protein
MSAPIVAGAPDAVLTPTATPGNNRATLRWATAPNNGAVITQYVITPYLGGVAQPPRTFAGPTTTAIITGLNDAKAYSFRIAAANARGTGPQSAGTVAVIVGAPVAPTGVSAKPGVRSATVQWIAPNDNGSPITGYAVTPYLGAVAQAVRVFHSRAPTRVIGGLAAGKAYTFRVAAINARGTGPPSAASKPVSTK